MCLVFIDRPRSLEFQSYKLRKAFLSLLNKQGVTLIELMVTVVISVIILAAVYTIFTSQHRSWVIRAQISEMQKNARTAMQFLAKDIRMAGFGMPETAVNGFSDPINPANNVTNGTDEITVVSAYRQVSTLSANASRGASSITLQSSADAAKFNTTTRRYLYLDGISEDDNYEVTSISGPQLTLTPNLTRDYSANCPVFLVKAITYRVDFTDPDHPSLIRDENTGDRALLIAQDIEDLQLAYQDVSGNWYNNPPSVDDILAVRINIIARTAREDPKWAGNGIRPAIEDHSVGNPDGYRRRILTTVVEVRNMGL